MNAKTAGEFARKMECHLKRDEFSRIDELTRLARIEAGKQKFRPREMDLASLEIQMRHVHAFNVAGVKLVSDVLPLSETEILAIPGIGPQALLELDKALRQIGLERDPKFRVE